jgi:O-antigen/teichoic acid export membrane protein
MSVRNAAFWSMGSQYTGFIINFAMSVIISRFFLTPAEVGLFSIALAAAMVVSILQDFGISRYIAGEAELDDAKIRVCASVSFLFAWGIALVILALAWPLSLFYEDPRLVPLMLIIGASYFAFPFAIVPTALLVRDMDFRRLFMINVGSALVAAVVAIALAWAGFSASALAWAQLLQFIFKAAFAQWLRPAPVPMPPQLAGAAPVLKFGTSASTLYLSGTIGVRSPDLIVGSLLTLTAVGLYSRANALAGQLRMLVSGALGGVFYPAFARLRDQGEAWGPYYIKVVSGYSVITWAAMAGLAVAAVPLVQLLYGEVWIEAAVALQWIALGEMCFVALPLHMDLPILKGRINTLIRYNIADTIVSIALLIIFARWGLEWAAISRLAYGLIWIGIYARLMHRIIGFDWPRLLSVYAKSMAATVAAVVPMLTAYQVWRDPGDLGFDGLILCTVLGIICWLGAIYLVRHPIREEITNIATSIFGRLGLLSA